MSVSINSIHQYHLYGDTDVLDILENEIYYKIYNRNSIDRLIILLRDKYSINIYFTINGHTLYMEGDVDKFETILEIQRRNKLINDILK